MKLATSGSKSKVETYLDDQGREHTGEGLIALTSSIRKQINWPTGVLVAAADHVRK